MSNKTIQLNHFTDYKDLRLINEMTDFGAFFNDDKITVRAQKIIPAIQSPTGKKQFFPFAKDWKKSHILKEENSRWYQ